MVFFPGSDGATRLTVYFETPNHLAAGLLVIVSLAVTLLAREVEIRHRFGIRLYSGITVLAFVLLLATQSRGGIIGCAPICLYHAFSTARIRVRMLVCAFLALLIVYITLGSQSIERIGYYADKSVISRFEVWPAALRMCLIDPISGIGRGNFGSLYTNWFQDIDGDGVFRTAVSTLLTWAVEFGIVPVGATLCVIVAAAIMVLNNCRLVGWYRQTIHVCVEIAASLALLGITISACFNTIDDDQRLITGYSLLALYVVLVALRRGNWCVFGLVAAIWCCIGGVATIFTHNIISYFQRGETVILFSKEKDVIGIGKRGVEPDDLKAIVVVDMRGKDSGTWERALRAACGRQQISYFVFLRIDDTSVDDVRGMIREYGWVEEKVRPVRIESWPVYASDIATGSNESSFASSMVHRTRGTVVSQREWESLMRECGICENVRVAGVGP